MKIVRRIYLCGPMRGYKDFNFPAFDHAQDRMERLGFKVLSPAQMDRECGFNPEEEYGQVELEACVKRDLEAIFKADMLILLDGWENSIGATAEVGVAKWLKKPIRLYKEYADII
jgi:nucleoside 2-deoxyribosyltransferase